ncbi:MAG: DUF4296 domain-containing protein, partial [Paramuribaculum sp.]|nr:DUF4296 domain-containing protein [Paramuribaculum sp.]
LSIAEAVVETDYRDFSSDSAKLVLKQSVLAKNKVTPQQMDSSLRWYGRNMDLLVEVYDRAIEMTQEDLKRNAINASATVHTKPSSVYATEGDSVDLWNARSNRLFAANMPANLSTFHLISDRNWQSGDIFTLSGKVIGAVNPLHFSITAEYQDGTKEYISSAADGSDWLHLKLPLNPDKTAATVYGYILYTPQGSEVVALDSISLVRTRQNTQSEALRKSVNTFAKDYDHLH